jgi:RimJ/RimL family protein N-acetyltransferase
MDFAIRRVVAEDASAFRALRLTALTTEPTAFSSSVEAEQHRPLSETIARIVASAASENFVFGAFDPASTLVGVCGFYRESGIKLQHVGWLWGMYVAPYARRHRLGHRIVTRVLEDAARLPGLRQLQLRVVSANAGAQRLYESVGFRPVAVLPRALCVDGEFYDDVLMVLPLDRDA